MTSELTAMVGLLSAVTGAGIAIWAQRANRRFQETKDLRERVACLLEEVDAAALTFDAITGQIDSPDSAVPRLRTIGQDARDVADALQAARRHAQYLELTTSWAVLEHIAALINAVESMNRIAGDLVNHAEDTGGARSIRAKSEFTVDRSRLVKFIRTDKAFAPSWAKPARRFFAWTRRRQLAAVHKPDGRAQDREPTPAA